MSEPTKRCSKCGLDLLLTEYHRNPHSADGRGTVCRYCRSEYQKARMAKARKKIKETGTGGGIDCNRCRFIATCKAHLWQTAVTPDGIVYWPLPCWAEHPATKTPAELQISRASVERAEEVRA